MSLDSLTTVPKTVQACKFKSTRFDLGESSKIPSLFELGPEFILPFVVSDVGKGRIAGGEPVFGADESSLVYRSLRHPADQVPRGGASGGADIRDVFGTKNLAVAVRD